MCHPCTIKKTTGKENVDGEGKVRSTTSQIQPSSLALDDCLMLLSMNKNSAFELDAYVTVPAEKIGVDLSVHAFANSLRDYMAQASDYHWK
jgi:hypothetical protein